jgi:hypothetical protein
VKCERGCTCGKHDQHRRTALPRNTKFASRRRVSAELWERKQLISAALRKQAENRYGELASDSFDMDAALARLRLILAEVYGT